MATKVGICNQALKRLGAARIDDINEASAEAEACKIFYDEDRKAVLESHAWGFATKTATLSQLAAASDGWDYAYQLPSDYVRVVGIMPTNVATTSVAINEKNQFTVRGNKFLTDIDAPLVLEYVYDLKDESLFSPQFVKCFAYHLASDLAMGVASLPNMQDQMYNLYERALADARSSDASQQRNQDVHRLVGHDIADSRF